MRCSQLLPMALVVAAGLLNGCGPAPSAPPAAPPPPASATASTAADHSGWWCTEHGMPEEICAQCNSKLAAEFKKKGDWCKEHDRPESQCLLCHPDLEGKFAAQYEAKYGKKPPKPELN